MATNLNEQARAAITKEIADLNIRATIARTMAVFYRSMPETRKQTARETKKADEALRMAGIPFPGVSFQGSNHSPQCKVYYDQSPGRNSVTLYLDKETRADGCCRVTYPFFEGAAKTLDKHAESYTKQAMERKEALETLNEKIDTLMAAGEAVKKALEAFREASRALPHEAREVVVNGNNWENFWRIC